MPLRGAMGASVVLLAALLAAGCARETTTAPTLAGQRQPAPTRPASEPRALFREALNLVAQGEDGVARTLFLELLETYPAFEDYHLSYLSEIEERDGHLPEAAAFGDRLIADHPDSVWIPSILARRARIAAAVGDARAAAFAARALAAPGTDAATRGAALLVRADLLVPGTPRQAYVLYQEVRRLEGEAAALARARSSALERDHPELLEEHSLLVDEGLLLLAEGRLDLAAARLQRAAAAAAAAVRAQALRALARVRQRQGRLEEAISSYRAAAAAEPPPGRTAIFALANLLWNRDRDDEAGVLFARLLREAPRHPKRDLARYALGRIAEQAGRQAEARSHYQRLITTAADRDLSREARWRVAWMHYMAGRLPAAIDAFAALSQASAADRAAALYWEARARGRRQGARAAAPLYRALLIRDPNSYYAELSERRLGESATAPPVPQPLSSEPPLTLAPHAYHWNRSRELRALGLEQAAIRELDAMARAIGTNSQLEPFLMEEYAALGAHHRALRLAARLERRRAVEPATLATYLYPRAYWPIVSDEAAAERLDPYLVLALMRQESLFDPEAVSPAAAHGLMQLLVSTASRIAAAPVSTTDLTDPATNVRLGTRYLRDLLDRYQGDLPKSLAAYNGGEDAVAKWEARAPDAESDEFVESISFRETRKYVKAVLAQYRHYRRLYGIPAELRALAITESDAAQTHTLAGRRARWSTGGEAGIGTDAGGDVGSSDRR